MSNSVVKLRYFKKQKLVLAMALPLLTTGCFFGDDNSPDARVGDKSPVAVDGFSGVAIDGYLRSAKACLDRNLNMSCDEGEESDVTDDQGRFNLAVSEEDSAKFPVVIEAIANITIDMDNPTEPIRQAYSLSAPAGNNAIVTPLTSLVEALRSTGLSQADAEQQVADQLGVSSVDMLYQDYIGKEDAESKKLHAISQVVVQVLSSALQQSVAKDSNQDKALVTQIGLRKVAVEQLAKIKLAVDENAAADGSLERLQMEQLSSDLFNENRDSLAVDEQEFNDEKDNAADQGFAAPVLISANDDTNLLSWQWVSGLTTPSDYEYSVDGGNIWQAVTANPQVFPNIVIGSAQLQLRVAANPALDRAQGRTLVVNQTFTANLLIPAAPANGVVDDETNSFGWSNAAGFEQISDYEYSVNSGITWQQVSANPQPLTDADYAAGSVQVRVKADTLLNRQAGEVLSSSTGFSKALPVPKAPTQLVVDDVNNRFSWTFSSVTIRPSDYEYSLNGGVSWIAVSANPQQLTDINVSAGQLLLRIAKNTDAGRAASVPISSDQAFTVTPDKPDAPTAAVVNDNQNLFSWQFSSGFSSAGQYEYSVDNANNWQAASANPQPLPDQFFAAGAVQVRVAADLQTGRPASDALVSTSAFTSTPVVPQRPNAPSGATHDDEANLFGWSLVSGYSSLSAYQYSLDAGSSWQPVTANPQSVGDVSLAVGAVQVRIAANADTGRPASLALLSTAAFTSSSALPAPDAATGFSGDDVNNRFDWVNNSDFTALADYQYSLDAGKTWQTVDAKPQSIPDAVYAAGAIQLRVAADTALERPAGEVLVSNIAFTATPSAPIAPTGAVVNDASNTFAWQWVAGFSTPADYEISFNNGASWNSVTANPQSVSDNNYATGQVQVRVKADAGTGRPSGAVLSNQQAYTQTPDAPSAPQNLQINDSANTFSWSLVSGFSQAADYEYSSDAGSTWQSVSAMPQVIGDVALAVGAVQVRVAADSANGRPAGAAAQSVAAFTVTPAAPAAPQSTQVNDNLNTFSWALVSGFSNPSDYEYSRDAGSTWQSVNAMPQVIGDAALAIGAVQVRVAADSTNGRPAGAAASSTAAFTVTPEAPVAPQSTQVDDNLNTFGWTLVSGFSNPSDYEYSLDAGSTWQSVSEMPVDIGDVALAVGAVQVRVVEDANTGRQAGVAAQSTQAFTVTPAAPAAPSAPQVDDAADTFGWTALASFPAATDYEYSIDSGANWLAVSANPQPVGDRTLDAGAVQVRVKADSQTGRPEGQALLSDAPYTATANQPDAPSAAQVDDALNTFGWTVTAGYGQASDYEYSLDSGVSWSVATGNPQSVPDEAYAISVVQVRVAANTDDGRPAGASLTSNAAFTVTPDQPEAPTQGVVEDDQDTFDWQLVAGFDQASAYEFSEDGGSSWQQVGQKPLLVGDKAIAVGDLQVRVRADQTNGRPAGKALLSVQAFTTSASTPDAPTAAVVDDLANTFGWTLVPTFSAVGDYEISVDNGQNWSAVTANPANVGDVDIALGHVQVRVKADPDSNRLAGAALVSEQAFTAAPAAPVAPTAGVVDDTADTFNWQNVPGFNEIAEYQYSTDSGSNWQTVVAKPIVVGDISLDVGALQVRVAADSDTGRPAGAALLSLETFTQGQGTVTADQATISGTHFAKLDTDGNYVAASTTIEDGWRCVEDLSSGNKVVWALLQDGDLNGADDLSWSEVASYLQTLNTQSTCGFNDWTAPKRVDLKTLRTVAATSSYDTIDTNVFPNHKPDTDELANNGGYSGSNERKLFYWTSDENTGWPYGNYAFSYYKLAGEQSAQSETETSFKLDSSSDKYALMLRAVRQEPRFEKFDATGNKLAADSDAWACLLDKRLQPEVYWVNKSEIGTATKNYAQTLAALDGVNQANFCGYSDWGLPSKQAVDNLVTLGDWGKAPWNMSYTWVNYDDSEDVYYFSGSRYSKTTETDNNSVLAAREKLNPAQSIALIENVLQALQNSGTSFSDTAQLSRTDFETAKQKYDEVVLSVEPDEYTQAKADIVLQQQKIDAHYALVQPEFEQLLSQVSKARSALQNIEKNLDGTATAEQIQQAKDLMVQVNTLWATLEGHRNSIHSQKEEITSYLARIELILVILGPADGEGVAAVQRLTTELDALKTQLQTAITEAENAQAVIDGLSGASDPVAAQRAIDSARALFEKLASVRLKQEALEAVLALLNTTRESLGEGVSTAVDALADSAQEAANTLNGTVITLQQTGLNEANESADKAREAGWVVSESDATISGTHFAKLDIAGRLIHADTTVAQGWQCVKDLSAGNNVVWALLRDGEIGGADDLIWPEVTGYIQGLNTANKCGFNDWAVPTIVDLKTLRTLKVGSYQTLDKQVFPKHIPDQSALDQNGSSSSERKQYYWSRDEYSSNANKAYHYYNADSRANEREESLKRDDSEAAKVTIIRAVRQEARFVKYDMAGNELAADSSAWSCLLDNRAMPPTTWMSSTLTSGDQNYGEALNTLSTKNTEKVCGFNNWELPALAAIESLILTGEWSDGVWDLWAYDYAWTRTPGDNDSEFMAVSGQNSIFSQSQDDKNVVFLTRQTQDPTAALAILDDALKALKDEESLFQGDFDASTTDFNAAKAKYDTAVQGTDVAVYETEQAAIAPLKESVDTRYAALQERFLALQEKVVQARALQVSIANNADGNFSPAQIQQAQSTITELDELWTKMSEQRNQVFEHTQQLVVYLDHLAQALNVLKGSDGNGGVAAVQQLTTQLQALKVELEAAITEADAAQMAVDALGGATDSAAAQRALQSAQVTFAKVESIRIKLLALEQALQGLIVAVNGMEVNVSSAVEQLADSVQSDANTIKDAIAPVAVTGREEGNQSYDKARQAGWSVSQADATIPGTEFAKLDLQGRFLPADASFAAGWRCVRDLRQGSNELTWALLEDGARGGVNDLSWDIGEEGRPDVQAMVARYNSQSYCGYDNWQVPMRYYLQTLETDRVDVSYYGQKATIDSNVFVNHQGFEAGFTSSSDDQDQYWYWSRDEYNSTKNYVYKYADSEDSATGFTSRPIGVNVDKQWAVMLRLMRVGERFEMVDSAGTATSEEAQWVCTREKASGALWSRQSGSGALTSSELNYVDALALVAEQNTASLCGRNNWQVPSIANLQVLAPLESALFSDVEKGGSSYYWSNESNGSGFSGDKNKCYAFSSFTVQESSCVIEGSWPDTNYLRLISPSN